MNKVGLFLLGEKGYEVLLHIRSINKIQCLKFIVADRDLNIKKDYFDEIKKISSEEGVFFLTRKEKNKEICNVDFAISIGWKWILDIDNLVVIHDSLLPKYRGFNPLVTALIEGDSTIGVSALLANSEMDKGDILFQEKVKINYPIKVQEAISLISPLYSLIVEKLLIQSFNEIIQTPQNDNESSYSIWRDELDYFIDWNNDASKIARFIDAVGYPYLGARTNYMGEIIIIEEVEVVKDLFFINRSIGKIFRLDNGAPIVLCGKGLLKIKKAFYSETNKQVIFNKIRIRLC
jgi:methionyl-tRNA formyltransferase